MAGDINITRFPKERSGEGRLNAGMRRCSDIIEELSLMDLFKEGPSLGLEG